ncbi:MAG: hypothetical protein HZA49_06070 [Planctomycetes bacterium]|nr:hypothetical protein [Planctomycetota bacterium]
MDIDITQSLKDTENSLRDFIALMLQQKLGESWVEKCGVTPERITKWNEKKSIEEKRQKTGTVEERLIYYADFYDLKTILEKNWADVFAQVFSEWKTMKVWLEELEKLRDPDAHRRELLPHQKHLAMGIAGEIRSLLIRYRSKNETGEDYFPRIESVRDSIGNIWAPKEYPDTICFTKTILRPNDIIDFIVTASDPKGEALKYGISTDTSKSLTWQKENTFSIKILKEDIRHSFHITLFICSCRDYHAQGKWDDFVHFVYQILPNK